MKVIRHEDRLWVSVEDHQKAVEFARMAAAIVEREECAKLCEEVHARYPTDVFPDGLSIDAQSAKMARITAYNCAIAIRARG